MCVVAVGEGTLYCNVNIKLNRVDIAASFVSVYSKEGILIELKPKSETVDCKEIFPIDGKQSKTV